MKQKSDKRCYLYRSSRPICVSTPRTELIKRVGPYTGRNVTLSGQIAALSLTLAPLPWEVSGTFHLYHQLDVFASMVASKVTRKWTYYVDETHTCSLNI